jgi:hypothetical protein
MGVVMDDNEKQGSKPPITDAQRTLLLKALDGSIADFQDLQKRYDAHLGILMNEAHRMATRNPGAGAFSYILDDLSKWSSLFGQLAKRIQQQSDFLGIDCSGVLQPVILGHESFVAEIKMIQVEQQIGDHKAIYENQMEILKRQAEMQERHRKKFWSS